MPVPLLIPIFVPLIGAVLVLVMEAVPHFRFAGIVAALLGVAALAAGLFLRLGAELPVDGVVSKWDPLLLFGVPLTFQADGITWGLLLVLLGVGTLTLFARATSLPSAPGGVHRSVLPGETALALALMGVGAAALMASSFVTLIITWAATDLMLAIALAFYGRSGARQAALALLSGVLATGAVWAAYLLREQAGVSGFLDLIRFTGRPAWLLQVAVTLRLGLVPLHLWRPIDLDIELPQIGPLILVPTLLGFDLLLQLPALTDGLPIAFSNLAALTIVVGGGIAWSQTDERRSIIGLAMAETGLAVLAVVNGGQYAVPVAVAAGVAWGLSMGVFALAPGWTSLRAGWQALPGLVALLSILGLPSTLGFVTRMLAYSGLEAGIVALVIALIGESLVVAAALRLWWWAEPRPLPARLGFRLLYLALFAVAAGCLILLGLLPTQFVGYVQDSGLPPLSELLTLGGVTGWAGWALPWIAGLTLFLAGEGVRQRLEGGWQRLSQLLRLEWLYALLLSLADQVGRFIRGLNGVLEGEGSLLWTTIVLLIILLFLRGGQP